MNVSVEMNQRVQDLEGEKDFLNMNQENFRMALDHAVRISTNQQNQIQNLMTDHLNLQMKMEQVLNTAGRLQQSNERIIVNNNQLQNDCLRQHNQMSQMDREIIQLHVVGAKKDNTIVEKDNTIVEKDNTITELTTQNTEKNNKIKDIKSINKDLYNNLKETRELCELKDSQLKKQCLVIEELQYNMDITNERLENLEQGLENKVDEIKRLTNDNMMQNKHISDQDQTIKDLRDKSQTQDQINKELFHQLEELKLM